MNGRTSFEMGGDVEAPEVHALLSDAMRHYRSRLRRSPEALAYLAERGITGAAVARFQLGYASVKWRDLGLVLARHSDASCKASGLLIEPDAGGRRRDRFRDRLMFPIRDRDGDVVGFGGRALGADAEVKYLNSPEGLTFRKSTVLYGLHEAQQAIQDAGHAIVVEGYFDVVGLWQAGIENVVSTMGTACSRLQLEQLLELTEHVVFCFDGDTAGDRAAAGAMRLAAPAAHNGRTFAVVTLEDGHDPDSFVRDHGPDAMRQVLASARPLDLAILDAVSQGCRLEEAEGRALCSHRAGAYWAALPAGPVRDGLRDFISGLLQIAPQDLEALWAQAHGAARAPTVMSYSPE